MTTKPTSATLQLIAGHMNSQFAAFRKAMRACTILFIAIMFSSVSSLADAPPAQSGPAYDVYDESWTAEDNQAWQKVLSTWKQIDAAEQSWEDKCHARWNALWPVAKAGNPEARYAVSKMLAGSYTSSYPYDFRIEGSISMNDMSSIKDGIRRKSLIGLFYGYGAPMLRYELKTDFRKKWVMRLGEIMSDIEQVQAYRKCWIETLSIQKCPNNDALLNDIIPPYEKYAERLDVLLKEPSALTCPADTRGSKYIPVESLSK